MTKSRIDFKTTTDLKAQYTETLSQIGLSITQDMNSHMKSIVNNRNELVRLNGKYDNKREELFNSFSVVDTFKREKDVTLPAQLVDLNRFENSVLLERVSDVLSLNELDQAYQFCMGLMNIIDNFTKPTQIIFTETDNKGRISTKLVRNIFGNAIIFVLIKALDDGHTIFTYTDNLQPIYTEHLFELLSEGISTSIHERTKVYDNLFFNKYNKAHFNQWLQWSFGLSRRDPLTEFNRLLRKNPHLVIDKSDIDKRSQKAIAYLTKRYTLFGLSTNGLQLAIEKIQTFVIMLHNYANDYNPITKCKNATIHHILLATNEKCPLRCGLKPIKQIKE